MSTRWAMFCEASSIRGMQKITKARSMFSRSLWTIFVLVMTLVLVITSALLVRDFLNYDTAWHTTTEFDNKPSFPSFTLCSHNPFSQAAKAAWESGAVLTPMKFQRMLRNISERAISQDLLDTILPSLFAYDNVDTYYQHLSYNDTVAISHNRSSLFFCVVMSPGQQVIAENCIFENLTVNLFSHSEFFNCFTVDSKDSQNFESIVVVISLVPAQDLEQLNHSFLYDVLNKGEGVKVTVHEQGVIPDFAQSGFNVEPGRMNEVNYATTAWQKLRTPKQECRDNQPYIKHLDREYFSDYHHCANAQLQQYLLKQCGCLNSLWPVIQVPSPTVPYCIDTSDNEDLEKLSKKLNCVLHTLENEAKLKANLSASACFPRCKYFTYESTLSITKWIPSPNKIEALADQYKAQNSNEARHLLETLRKNVSQYKSKTYNSRLSQQNSYTYIKIRRKNWDVIKKIEKLTLDVNILLSRIGGLCSLCIGLTAAFVVEMIEFVYLSFQPVVPPTPGTDGFRAGSSGGGNGGGGDVGGDGVEAIGLEQATPLMPSVDPWEKGVCAEFGTQPNHAAARVGKWTASAQLPHT